MKFEFKTENVYEPWPEKSPAQVLMDAAEDGWDFCGCIPGYYGNVPAEHHRSLVFMFKRVASP